jgi:hypothetical protein
MKNLILFAVLLFFVACQKKSNIVSSPPVRNLVFTWWAAPSDSTNTYTPTASSYININGTQYSYPFPGISLNGHKWVYPSVLSQGTIFSSEFAGTFSHLGGLLENNFAMQVHCDCDLNPLLNNGDVLVSQLPNGDIVFGANPSNHNYKYVIVIP